MNTSNNRGVILAAVAGAVVGAVAGAMLSDEGNRKKVAATAKKVGREGGKYVEDFRATAHEIAKGAGQKVEETRRELDDKAKSKSRGSRKNK